MSRKTGGTAAVDGTHLWLVLWKSYTAVRAFAEASIVALGLSLTDFVILEALLHKGPLPVNEIGKKVSLTSGSMTAAIDRMTQRGLVERKGLGSDRRARVVHLTEEGERLIARAFQRHSESLDGLGEVLNLGERQQAIDLLKRLGRAAEAATLGGLA